MFSPFFLWAAWGLFRWWRSGQDRPDYYLVLGSLVLLPLFLSAYPNWHGGWSLGSRYLVPLVFLAALPVGRALESTRSRECSWRRPRIPSATSSS